MKVLIADDDEIMRILLANAVRHAGHDADTCEDGDQALARALTGEYRMMLVDWEMPGRTGIAVTQAIRNAGLPAYVYIIMVSSMSGCDSAVTALESGVDDFVRKPFDQAELMARIRAAERMLALETRELAIFAMAKLAESRDPETGLHLERVRGYCRVLTAAMSKSPRFEGKVTGEFSRMLYETSPLHDIGKVGIPDYVLLKPGRLSASEFAVMQSHTTLGAETLAAAAQTYPDARFLQMARDVALTHHERWDGSGYPRGLAGEDIPLCGRITAVADVYDALTSERVYKSAMPHDVARAIMLGDSGKHFDPSIIEVFLECEAEILKVRDRYAEQPRLAA